MAIVDSEIVARALAALRVLDPEAADALAGRRLEPFLSPASRSLYNAGQVDAEAIDAQKSAFVSRIRKVGDEIQSTKNRLREIEIDVAEKGRSHDKQSCAEVQTLKADLAEQEDTLAKLKE